LCKSIPTAPDPLDQSLPFHIAQQTMQLSFARNRKVQRGHDSSSGKAIPLAIADNHQYVILSYFHFLLQVTEDFNHPNALLRHQQLLRRYFFRKQLKRRSQM
jgi:hypothetical protein